MPKRSAPRLPSESSDARLRDAPRAYLSWSPCWALSATGEHESIVPTTARLLHSTILVGVLVYFLRTPIAEYLRTRSGQIRQDLVTAADTRRTATAQLEEIKRRLE